MSRVLVLCSGDNTGVNFVRSLRLLDGYTIVGLDFYLDDYHASEADHRYLITFDSASLVSSVNRLVDLHKIELIYVADTVEAMTILSRDRESLSAATLLPNHRELATAEDKWETYLRLTQCGVEVPDTVLVSSPHDLEEIFSRHQIVWLRRRSGSGGRGALASKSLKLALAWVDSADGWGDFTAAECLTQRTATLSGLWKDGVLVASQLRERVAWKYSARSPSGVTGITGGQKTVWDSELHELGLRAVRAVAPLATGAIGVDFTYDRSELPRVTEIQPGRFYSSIHFLARAGINFPHLYCELALQRSIGDTPIVNPIRHPLFWLKAVDKEPLLLTGEEYLAAKRDVEADRGLTS